MAWADARARPQHTWLPSKCRGRDYLRVSQEELSVSLEEALACQFRVAGLPRSPPEPTALEGLVTEVIHQVVRLHPNGTGESLPDEDFAHRQLFPAHGGPLLCQLQSPTPPRLRVLQWVNDTPVFKTQQTFPLWTEIMEASKWSLTGIIPFGHFCYLTLSRKLPNSVFHTLVSEGRCLICIWLNTVHCPSHHGAQNRYSVIFI